MKFHCPDCGQRLEVTTLHEGKSLNCPACKAKIQIPDKLSYTIIKSDKPKDELRMDRTIDLENNDASGDATEGLQPPDGQRYQRGKEIAKGGMGAILSAKDLNIRRNVAMKVLLEPSQASKAKVQRFIHEAQITGQLEHPSIVPLHDLGTDAEGKVFYTMKYVEGDTLKDILQKIKDADKKAIKDFPLSRLLNIFMRVCDAIAFAHSKNVIHRDLKPDNIMIGEYGEVLVLDWGLAKVLSDQDKELPKRQESKELPEGIHEIVDSIRMDTDQVMKTMDGDIMGTPGYMAPEQAKGEIDDLNERTDIYALGAILYTILTLRPPLEGNNVNQLLLKTVSGEIKKPTTYNQGKVELVHCPASRIPDALSAVAMRALATEQSGRYPSVEDLQKDIEAYQGGFLTSVEDAGIGKQIKLFIKRNKVASVAALLIGVLLVGSSVINYVQRNEAVAQRDRADRALSDLKDTAPALISASKRFVESRQLDEAVKHAESAVSLVPQEVDYLVHLGNLLQASLELDLAIKAYGQVLRLDEGHEQAQANRDLCERLLKEYGGKDNATANVIGKLYPTLVEQGRFPQALAMLVSANPAAKDTGSLKTYYEQHLRSSGVQFQSLTVIEGGFCELSFQGDKISDLSPLTGMPLTGLRIPDNQVTDLSPLKGMPLKSLNVGKNRNLSDLSPLTGLPLNSLSIFATKVSDLSPLKGMPLTVLNVSDTAVADLSPLQGIELTRLYVSGTPVANLSPLKGMPLTSLHINGTRVSDISPLKEMPLKSLNVINAPIRSFLLLKDMKLSSFAFNQQGSESGIEVIRNMPSLTTINQIPTAEFWKKYDAGEFNE